MRTTVDLPDDVHRAAMRIAQDRGQSLSRTIAALLRTAMHDAGSVPSIEIDPSTGLPTVHVSGRLTVDDVAAADE